MRRVGILVTAASCIAAVAFAAIGTTSISRAGAAGPDPLATAPLDATAVVSDPTALSTGSARVESPSPSLPVSATVTPTTDVVGAATPAAATPIVSDVPATSTSPVVAEPTAITAVPTVDSFGAPVVEPATN